MRTTKVKSTGKFGARYGATVKDKYRAIASKQNQKQQCPFCKKSASKRIASGLWHCKSCGKKFAGHAYYLGAKV